MRNSRIDYILDAVGITFTISQTEELFRLISIVLVCLSTAVSLAFSLYNWWKKAKSDGQITKEEIEEGKKILNEHLHKIDDIKKNKKEE